MTATLAITFDLGRYHATPWGANVNEGAVEIPPSPWRLLRALYSTWRVHANDLPQDLVHGLLSTLAATEPVYAVPPHTIAHTRHYYPDSTSRRGTTSTDKTIDAFAAFATTDASLYVTWPVELSPDYRDALERLAKSLPYLGRADSVITAKLTSAPDEY
ncbi:MAG: CRISPR-associated protein Csb2, partial [Actinomycetota bacterium]|nr:CRISPR-associated protein Csb2 [Actinomycetota bacterium]